MNRPRFHASFIARRSTNRRRDFLLKSEIAPRRAAGAGRSRLTAGGGGTYTRDMPRQTVILWPLSGGGSGLRSVMAHESRADRVILMVRLSKAPRRVACRPKAVTFGTARTKFLNAALVKGFQFSYGKSRRWPRPLTSFDLSPLPYHALHQPRKMVKYTQ